MLVFIIIRGVIHIYDARFYKSIPRDASKFINIHKFTNASRRDALKYFLKGTDTSQRMPRKIQVPKNGWTHPLMGSHRIH